LILGFRGKAIAKSRPESDRKQRKLFEKLRVVRNARNGGQGEERRADQGTGATAMKGEEGMSCEVKESDAATKKMLAWKGSEKRSRP